MANVIVIRVERILGSNIKMAKIAGPASRYLVTGITLAPGDLSGHEVCQWRTRGCFGACVMHYAGQRRMSLSRERALRLTQWLFADRESFETQLHLDIALHVKRAESEGRIPTVRLNAGSDLDWMHVIRMWPGVTFFDYTKSRKRMDQYLAGLLPANYHLTFSASERTSPEQLRNVLERGGNVAMVFDVTYNPQHDKIGPLQKTKTLAGKRFRIVDGDTHDVRLPEIDCHGVIVGLRLKGINESKATARRTGFAVT